jgi:5-enolpyruvylshikimate-3-phosphate synthase
MAVRSKIDWQFHVAQQHKSGLTAREYSKRNGFSAWSFYTNRKRLSKNNLKIRNDSSASTPFLELGAISARSGLTIVLSNGTSIEFHGQQSTEQLACILNALQRNISGGAR